MRVRGVRYRLMLKAALNNFNPGLNGLVFGELILLVLANIMTLYIFDRGSVITSISFYI